MARIRMYEPWGYQDENNYQSSEITMENDFESFFTDASYKDDDKSIHFYNKDGNERVKIDVTKFAPSVVESATYDEETKILTIEFSNGDKIQINLAQLIDEHEFGDGLNVEDGIVSIKIDAEGEPYVSVGENGVKISGVDQSIADAVDVEKTRAEQAESELQEAITAEETRATGAEQTLNEKIDAEETRAEASESALNTRADSLNDTIDAEKTIREAADVALGGRIDQEISDRIADVDAEETRAKAVETELQASIASEASERAEKDAALEVSIENEKTRAEGAELALRGSIDAETARAISAETDLQSAIDLKADKETTYTQEEVDALIKTKETEIYNLTKLVGEIGGNVVYDYPNDLGTSLTTLLGNNGTVKMTDDATISRFGPGITAKNIVKLNLNGNDLISTSAGGYGAIMSRGTQNITIYGKGTIDAGDGICIEANGKDSEINLTGSTTVYHNDRSGGELIYCFAGTINITNGTFRNNGEDKTYILNCYDANYQAGTAKIIVTGGKFYDFNPADNKAEGEHTNFLAEGYHVETSTVIEEGVEHTVYTVKKDA